MEIKVKEITTVKPAEKTPRRSIWLSDLDLLFDEWYNVTVNFYKPNGASHFFNPMVLKEALGKALVLYYPMAGRFRHDDDGRLEIDCNGEGVLFVEAECSSAVDQFGDFVPSPELRSLTSTADFSAGISSSPFMLSQVTYFQCGGVSLGIGMEHRVMDGDSAFHFLKAWSEIARGLDVTLEPIFDRKILNPRHPSQLISNHTEYFTQAMKPSQHQQQINTADESDRLSSSIKVVVLKVTSSQLKMLKAKAGKEGSTVNYSTFEILAGHIWKCASIACKLPIDEETGVFFAVNGRTRLQPPIPHGYFGNVVFKGGSSSTPGDLQSKPLWFAASRIHQGLATLNNNYLRSVIDYLNLNPGTKLFGANDYKHRKFLISSWLRLPVHDADFGWGKPFYMGPGGSSLSEGSAFIVPNGAKDGSLSLIIALQHEHIKVFEKLFYEPMNSFGQSKL